MSTAVPKSVIVTGGADGIGAAIAQRFLAGGHKVHICDIRAAAVERALENSPGLHGSIVDVADADAVAKLAKDAAESLGPVGVLVNNVGIGGGRAAIEDIAPAEWEQVFRVNVAGALYCMQSVIPEMKARRSGVLINISTASTQTRLPFRTPYVASKYALEGLTLNAARELGPWNIRCNAILPGLMNNARMDAIIAQRAEETGRAVHDVEQEFLRCVSLRARTEPADIAETAWFLASDAAARITGELMSVSGNLEWEE